MTVLLTILVGLAGPVLVAMLAWWLSGFGLDEDDPASHAVAHAEGWPCSCQGPR